MSKTFFDHCQRFVVVAALGIEEPAGRQPRLGERRSEQVAALDYPQHHSVQAGGNSGCEQTRRGIVAGRTGRSRNFMQSGH